MNEILTVLENPKAVVTLAVLILAVFLFVTSALAPELTGLLSVALLMATGVLSPQKALAGFGSPALITLMGLFAVSAGPILFCILINIPFFCVLVQKYAI